MRQMIHQQVPILPVGIQHGHAHELAEMSRVLDELQKGADLLELISRELLGGRRPDTGRKGLTAEQVRRILVLKQMLGLTYDQLAFHLADSSTYRLFCRVGMMDPTPKRSALQSNLKRLSSGTIEAINRHLLRKADVEGIEKGRTVRGDCTAVETNIHHPSDSSLLHDGVRVLARLLQQGEEATGRLGTYRVDHTRRARRRALQIANARNGVERVKYYRDLLHITHDTVGYAEAAMVGPFLERHVQLYGRVPRQVTLDGGFASKDNLDILKRAGVQDAAFHKKRGLKVPDMVRSSWLYRQLVRFRSGIESVISCLKRCFGWTRCG